MGIPAFDAWSIRHTQSVPLTSLKDRIIGLDAAYYLERLLHPAAREPLLSALGGWPLALDAVIAKELSDMQTCGMKPHFVFDGLDYGIKDDPFQVSITATTAIGKAFAIYEKGKPLEARNAFVASGVPKPEALFEFLKKVLYDHHIEFTVAPYSALAQLVYYEKDPGQFMDAVYGPSELFLFGIDKIITKFSLSYDPVESDENDSPKKMSSFSLDNSTFAWIDRRTCLEQLGGIHPDVFIDALLLAGPSMIETFPPLRNTQVYHPNFSMRDAVNILLSSQRSVPNLCALHQDDRGVKRLDYLDRYKRVLTSIKHHVIITTTGSVEILDAAHAPSDVHECIGQRLPEELSHYLFRGMIKPRVLNWLTTGNIIITAPYVGGDSPDYQDLVTEHLQPWRKQALCLLADSLHRYYQKKEVVTRFWFGEGNNQRFNMNDLLPSQKSTLRSWRVKDNLIEEGLRGLQRQKVESLSLYIATRSIVDEAFASKTITAKPRGEDVLRTTREVILNVVWRFLRLREYLNDQHQLTPWGLVLEKALNALGSDPSREQTEATFVAVELVRLGLLSPSTSSSNNADHNRNEILVSRVASLGKLRHSVRGYSGPLSRELLAYQSITSEVQAGLRDLVEMSLVSLFLEGEADRDRKDWMEISLGLPFFEDTSCAVGVLVRSYLEEMNKVDDPTSASTRAAQKDNARKWLAFGDFQASFDNGLQIWDAVYSGVAASSDLLRDKKIWDEVDQWLSLRR